MERGTVTVRLGRLPLVAVVLVAAGCGPQSIYRWGHYEGFVYDMYANPGKADPGTQIASLSEDIDKAHGEGKLVPPGVHAHLGYLYYQQGNRGSAEREFENEKTLFPESAKFIDGILARMRRQ